MQAPSIMDQIDIMFKFHSRRTDDLALQAPVLFRGVGSTSAPENDQVLLKYPCQPRRTAILEELKQLARPITH